MEFQWECKDENPSTNDKGVHSYFNKTYLNNNNIPCSSQNEVIELRTCKMFSHKSQNKDHVKHKKFFKVRIRKNGNKIFHFIACDLRFIYSAKNSSFILRVFFFVSFIIAFYSVLAFN